jgi:hypothetical protein
MTVLNVRNVTFRSPDSVTSAYGVSMDTVRSDCLSNVANTDRLIVLRVFLRE